MADGRKEREGDIIRAQGCCIIPLAFHHCHQCHYSHTITLVLPSPPHHPPTPLTLLVMGAAVHVLWWFGQNYSSSCQHNISRLKDVITRDVQVVDVNIYVLLGNIVMSHSPPIRRRGRGERWKEIKTCHQFHQSSIWFGTQCEPQTTCNI